VQVSDDAVLAVDGLHVRYRSESGPVHALRGVSLSLRQGESLAIVGESGAGKSALALAIMGLLPAGAHARGRVMVHGDDMLGQDDETQSRVRGRSMAMIFQDPLSAMTPVYTVGQQIVEAILAHQAIDRSSARRRAVELLDLVGIAEPDRRFDAYPHEFSGGMRQRAMIAMAVANDPAMIIADEPTTALDVTVQAQVLDVLQRAQRETGAALLLITHDLGVVAGMADRVGVMYAGRIVEEAAVDTLFQQPRMPYSIGLLGCIPSVDSPVGHTLASVDGMPPAPNERSSGCPFAPRCPLATNRCCESEPDLISTDQPSQRAACFESRAIAARALTHRDLFAAPVPMDLPPASQPCEEGALAERDVLSPESRRTVLQLTDMVKHHPLYAGALFRRRIGTVHAVDGIDLELQSGETLALVGESGCGKSTTAHAILDLAAPTRGSIVVHGTDVSTIGSRAERLALRRRLQIVFQDPVAALDPRMPVADLIAEPLNAFGVDKTARAARIDELMALVELDHRYLESYPRQLSGGQRQRVGIARALAASPDILVLDEPVSALDVSVRASIINLLDSLQARLGLAYLFVGHDLAIVRHVADRVAVMYLGKIVETGDVASIFDRAAHPYTQALLSAVPLPDPARERARTRILLGGELPDPAAPPSGCRFHARCPKRPTLDVAQQARCADEPPRLGEIEPVPLTASARGEAASVADASAGNFLYRHTVACHFPD